MDGVIMKKFNVTGLCAENKHYMGLMRKYNDNNKNIVVQKYNPKAQITAMTVEEERFARWHQRTILPANRQRI